MSKPTTFKFKNYQHSIMCGSLLGDANISNDTRTKGYSLQLRFNQGLHNKSYVEHLFAMFQDMVHPNTTTLCYATDKNGDKTCSFNTRVNDALAASLRAFVLLLLSRGR